MLSDTVILCLCDLRNGVEKDLVNPRAWQTVLVAPTTGGYEQDGAFVWKMMLLRSP